MRRRYFRFGGFGMGFPPFGFFFHGPGRFPRREDYVRMLEEYKEDLEEELNPARAPSFEAVATQGVGVFDTLKCVSKLVLRKLA